MSDLVILGGIAIDHLCRVKDAKATYSQALDYSENLGGMAYNTSVATAQLGIKTILVSPVGDDFPGAPSLRNLTYNLQKAKGKTTRCTLIYDGKSERIYFLRGVYHDIDIIKAKAAIKKADWVHFAGVAPCFSELAGFAKKSKKTISSNLGYDLFHYPPKDKLLKGLIERSNYLIMSDNEIGYLGIDPRDLKGKTIIKTMGKKGSVVFEGNKETKIKTYPVKVGSPFGAGDTYTGTFIAAKMSKRSTIESARLASAAGSFAVEEKTTTPKLNWGKIKKRAKKLV